jgi:predicted aspartyl protease
LTGRQTNEQTGLLVAALSDGRPTYGQFAAQQMNLMDQMMGSLSGSPTPDQGARISAEPIPATASPATGPSAGVDEITLQRKGGTYLVPVAVNGLPPMPFVLDSGADVVALPAEAVFTLWRTGTLRSSDFIGNTTFVMADGRELPSVKFKIRELRVGRHAIRDVVGGLNPALTDQLLGGSFLSRFTSWSIDNQRNALVLSR